MAPVSSLPQAAPVGQNADNDQDLDLSIHVLKSIKPRLRFDSIHQKAQFFRALRDLLYNRFKKGRSVVDLREAAALGRDLVALNQIYQQNVSDLSTLAAIKTSQFQISKAKAEIDDAISLGLGAKELFRVSDSPEVAWLNVIHNLGCGFFARSQLKSSQSDQMRDLDESINCSREELKVAAPRTPAYNTALANLGTRLLVKSKQSRDLAAGEEALEINRQCQKEAVQGSLEHCIAQQNLGQLLLAKYEQTGYWRDLEEAIRLQHLVTSSLNQDNDHKLEAYINLTIILRKKYDRTKDASDLQDTIRICHEVASRFPQPEAERGRTLLTYITNLRDLVNCSVESSVAEDAIRKTSKLIESMPQTYPEKQYVLNYLGQIMSRKYELSSDTKDLVKLTKHACELVSYSKSPRHYGLTYPDKDEQSLKTLLSHVLNLAVAAQDHYIVVQLAKLMHQEYCQFLTSKDFIASLISLDRDATLTVDIVELYGGNVDSMIEDIGTQKDFAFSLGAKTWRSRMKLQDLRLKPGVDIDSLRKMVAPLSKTKSDELLQLAEKSHEEVESLEQLNKAVKLFDSVIIPGLSDETERAHVLDMGADLMIRSYEATDDLNDLKLAMEKAKEGLLLKPDGSYLSHKSWSHTRCTLLGELGNFTRTLYLQTRSQDWLTEAHFFGLAAVKTTSRVYTKPDSRDEYLVKTAALICLANALKSRFQLQGAFGDLEKAIEITQEAIKLDNTNPHTKYEDRAACINQLALMMRLRFFETGEIDDLNTGIRHLESYITANSKMHEKPTMTNLPLITNLSLLYSTKCDRVRDLADINKAIEYGKKAMDLSGAEAAEMNGVMHNYANALLHLYHETNNASDLNDAVHYASRVGERVMKHDLQYPEVLLDASFMMKISYLRDGDKLVLDRAVQWAGRAVSLTPSSHSWASDVISAYANLLEIQFEDDGSQETLEKCIDAYKKAVNSEIGGRIKSHDDATRRFYRLLISQNRYTESLEQMERLLESIDHHCPRWLPFADRQFLLSSFHSLPSDMCAIILHLSLPNNAYKAICSLERSRGVLLGSTMDFRSEAKHLEEAHGTLLTEWNRICMELDSCVQETERHQLPSRRQIVSDSLIQTIESIRSIPGFRKFIPPLDLGSMTAYDLQRASPTLFQKYNSLQREHDSFPVEKEGGRLTRRQKDLSHQMDEMLVKIRNLHGLENFLLPPSEAEMMALARDGPIIILNNSETIQKSDALIITKYGIETLPLPDLRSEDIRHQMQQQREALTGWSLRNMGQKNRQMSSVLMWLWASAVKPILDHLNIMGDDIELRPRVHWIGTGILSSAPFHAAGDHSDGSRDNAISRVISSYISNLRALSFAREEYLRHKFQDGRNIRRVLLVSVPEAPNATRLPAVDVEVAAIAKVSEPHATVIKLDAPGPSSVLQELPLAQIVHLACHAKPDTRDVTSSHLLLMPDPSTELTGTEPITSEDAKKIVQPGRLSVRDISARRAPSAEIAYLSACSAAETNPWNIADESIHIASAFQLAGFKHVIGTLWQAKDRCCRQVAEEFYATLFVLDGEKMGLRAPEALDCAVRMLRERNPERVLDWVPFVHIGA